MEGLLGKVVHKYLIILGLEHFLCSVVYKVTFCSGRKLFLHILLLILVVFVRCKL